GLHRAAVLGLGLERLGDAAGGADVDGAEGRVRSRRRLQGRGRVAGRLARYAARSENFVLVAGEPHNGPGAPQARPPERSGDRGAPRAKAWGVRGGEAPESSKEKS